MTQTLKKLFLISRPVSWLNTAYPFAAAYILAGGQLNLLFFIATFYFLIPYNLLMYGINDVFDYESDIRNPRKGGLEGMREQKAFHPTIVVASLVSTLPFIVLMAILGTVQATIALLLLTFFVVAYSIKWLRFKERPILDSITSSIHFVGPAVYALLLTAFSAEAWPLIIAFFLWGMASHALGAIQDIVPDRTAKIASIATVFGARLTLILVILLYTFAVILTMAQGTAGLIIGITGLIYVINVLPYWRITDITSGTINRAWRRFIWLNMVAGFAVTMVILFF